MTAQALIIAGSIVLGILGFAHYVYVLLTNKFHAYNDAVTQSMHQTSPVLTKDTTMWQAWIGFNYSHSFGVLWIPFIYIPLAINHFHVLQNSLWLTLLLPVMALIYTILAKRYWFSIPLIGSMASFICYSFAFYFLHMN